MIHAGRNGDLVPEIAGQAQQGHPAVTPGQFGHPAGGAIGAAIVDQDELELLRLPGHGRAQALVHQRKVFLFVQERHHDRYSPHRRWISIPAHWHLPNTLI